MTGKTILVVEDDLSIRESIQELLEAEGYTVLLAENGKRALKVLEKTLPSLILLDLFMPVMDGKTFITKLRERHPDFAAPILIMTAAGAGDVPDHPANLVFRKPFEVGALMDCIEREIKKTK